ncbi:MAG TPA: hypothetical protein VMF08_21570 [Candidatus Sulfotelmatobacter sp.]|nr:hypothetical protein [Candidatus Sulfotelmatobacter sp.]
MAAFGLTFWQQRSSWCIAAGFYTAGTLVGIGVKVYLWLLALWLAIALSDGSSTDIPWAGLILPITASLYGIASVVLVWPWIGQKNAMRFGKILHLIVLPVFFSTLLVCTFLTRGQALTLPELQWLVYGPLWFRIRETINPSASRT